MSCRLPVASDAGPPPLPLSPLATFLPALPVRNASGTNPMLSQNRFASRSCAHQQQ